METLKSGTQAPPFTLSGIDGKSFSLRDALSRGPVMLAFFKKSCPVCQYAFPFYQRMFQAYGNRGVILAGVSQNQKKDTEAFAKSFGVTFPILLDDPATYPVSNAYGLTNVPTVFWIGQNGKIEISSVGWNRKDFEVMSGKMAEAGRVPAAVLLEPKEQVADFRFG
jgi:cytochrome c biogenesis protein CcmG/thiol:disulfide interchange protein DsbE